MVLWYIRSVKFELQQLIVRFVLKIRERLGLQDG
jgi:hypothetical protein